jgi:hypothetical protein
MAACSRRRTPGSSDSNCRSGSSSPEVAGEVCRFFFGRNCRSSGCIELRELHVTALGGHSPSTYEQAAGAKLIPYMVVVRGPYRGERQC